MEASQIPLRILVTLFFMLIVFTMLQTEEANLTEPEPFSYLTTRWYNRNAQCTVPRSKFIEVGPTLRRLIATNIFDGHTLFEYSGNNRYASDAALSIDRLSNAGGYLAGDVEYTINTMSDTECAAKSADYLLSPDKHCKCPNLATSCTEFKVINRQGDGEVKAIPTCGHLNVSSIDALKGDITYITTIDGSDYIGLYSADSGNCAFTKIPVRFSTSAAETANLALRGRIVSTDPDAVEDYIRVVGNSQLISVGMNILAVYKGERGVMIYQFELSNGKVNFEARFFFGGLNRGLIIDASPSHTARYINVIGLEAPYLHEIITLDLLRTKVEVRSVYSQD